MRISRATSAAAASRPAAGRRRSNSCRRCGGHRPRHSPAAHSRRPCRAIRRGWRNSRSPRRDSRFMAIIVSTSRSRTAAAGIGQGDAGQHPVAAAGQQLHAGAQASPRPRPWAGSAGRPRRPCRRPAPARRARSAATASAFSRASRSAWSRGSSPFGHAFVDVGGDDRVGHDADPRQQVEAARARRGEDEPHRAAPAVT